MCVFVCMCRCMDTYACVKVIRQFAKVGSLLPEWWFSIWPHAIWLGHKWLSMLALHLASPQRLIFDMTRFQEINSKWTNTRVSKETLWSIFVDQRLSSPDFLPQLSLQPKSGLKISNQHYVCSNMYVLRFNRWTSVYWLLVVWSTILFGGNQRAWNNQWQWQMSQHLWHVIVQLNHFPAGELGCLSENKVLVNLHLQSGN